MGTTLTIQLRIPGGDGDFRVAAEVPGHGYYSCSVRVFEALTYKQAVRRLDAVHDGEWDEGETNEEGRALYWIRLLSQCGEDEGLLAVVARIMAGDTLGSDSDDETVMRALDDIKRYYS